MTYSRTCRGCRMWAHSPAR